ncbi:ATP-binding cassette domain-containing protein [Phytoactinopolyspora halotolerans]|uniref:ATP-binding cassette domain-containing protein n=1 Tax=Phytoactinopolyspora halotolerans TaxID=1981512 RepID=A0A6L9S7E8_9ACTN|nr:ATP-binding cassette domain-containing protein [Phytoactinopolyspora halotolerans]NEE00502.1 ATP-binding cassette domain-containing protein [Phytoactinopolyspora halotolerans]
MITARGLARTFQTRTGPVEAVRGVDIDVADGEIVGLLGPNGAGKTTTLRMLTTLITPTAGDATIAGHDLRLDPRGVRSGIGYVPQGGSTGDDGVVMDELILQARLFRLSKADARRSATELLGSLDLNGLDERTCKQLSGGQRRRVDIALGLVHRPGLVFLDEPTTGLDPQSRANLWDHIRDLRARGTTIVITTHYLDEADALCDRILVMDHGTVVAEGTPDELKRRISGDIITLDLDHADAGDAETVVRVAEKAVAVRSSIAEHGRIHLTVEHGDQSVIPLLRALDGAGVTPGALTVKRPSLDDVFLAITGRSLRDAEQHPDPARTDPAQTEPTEAGAAATSSPNH